MTCKCGSGEKCQYPRKFPAPNKDEMKACWAYVCSKCMPNNWEECMNYGKNN